MIHRFGSAVRRQRPERAVRGQRPAAPQRATDEQRVAGVLERLVVLGRLLWNLLLDGLERAAARPGLPFLLPPANCSLYLLNLHPLR